MLLLAASEVSYWRTTRVEDHLLVDGSQGDRDVTVSLDVTFHVLPCRDIVLGAEDSKGQPYDASHARVTLTPVAPPAPEGGSSWVGRLALHRLSKPGVAVTPPADAPASGCRVRGSLRLKKVAGSFHVAAPRQLVQLDGHFAYAVPPEVLASYNASHTVHSLAFGPPFPGQVNPILEYTPGRGSAEGEGPDMWQYHLRVVPTLYTTLYGSVTDSQQYSVTDFVTAMNAAAGVHVHPGVWWRFDFSPIMVRKRETRRSFLQFLTSLFAILGGVYTLSGIVDTVLWRSVLQEKSK